MNISAKKAAARQQAFGLRKNAFATGLDSQAQTHLNMVLQGHEGKILAGYMPINTEISPLPIMEKWSADVCVPFIKGKGQPLDFLRWTSSSEMERGAFGAAIPKEKKRCIPEILIVPLVAFTHTGHRLGYGGGFYDRTLVTLRKKHPIFAIGFAYSAQQMDRLPLEKTDIALNIIVTEKGIIQKS